MNIFLNVGLPIIVPATYAAIGLSVFHRFRRRHLSRGCPECERKIRENTSGLYGGKGYRWNNLLCDRYDLGAFATAAFWPVAWLGYWLYSVTKVDDRPRWLVETELRDRIAELEREAGIS